MQEIVARGPITVGILPDFRLSQYGSGVIRKNQRLDALVETESEAVSHLVLKDYGKEWEEVEHAVLIYGYGETK